MPETEHLARRTWGLAACLSLGVPALLIMASYCRAAPERRPNIVLVVLDTVRRDHLPFYGYPRDTAPFLTELSKRSVVFDKAYSTSAWTSPAVASLFTSLVPQRHGVVLGTKQIRESGFELSRLPSDVDTIPLAVRGAGYATYAVSDNLNVSELLAFDRGFDRFEAASDASGVAVNKRLKQWGESIRSREPYLLFIQYMDAHAPYEPKGPWFERFMAAPLPTFLRPDHVAAYDSEIRFVDERLQGLFEAFGWGHDTVVIITADHGEELGDHGQTGHGQALTPELMNIPLMVFGPGFPPHHVQDPVSLVDILPTVRELAGSPVNPANEGWSLVPLLRGGRWDRPARPLFAHLLAIGTSDVSEAVIYRDLKLVRGPGRYVGLFDLAADPQETTDIAASRRADVDRLLGMLPPRGPPRRNADIDVTSLPPELVEQLRSLGYIK